MSLSIHVSFSNFLQILNTYFEKYKGDGKVHLEQLRAFLQEEQNDVNLQPHDIMNNFFQDPNRTGLPHMTEEEVNLRISFHFNFPIFLTKLCLLCLMVNDKKIVL